MYVKELKYASGFLFIPLQLQRPYVSDRLRINTYFGFWTLFGGLSAGGDLLLRVSNTVHFSMGSEIDIEPIFSSLIENDFSQLISVIMVSVRVGLNFLF
jgi:hypothetical protein